MKPKIGKWYSMRSVPKDRPVILWCEFSDGGQGMAVLATFDPHASAGGRFGPFDWRIVGGDDAGVARDIAKKWSPAPKMPKL